MFSKNVKKTQKAVQKITKSGTTGLKNAVQKGIKKVREGTQRRDKVEMEEFEVEIGEI